MKYILSLILTVSLTLNTFFYDVNQNKSSIVFNSQISTGTDSIVEEEIDLGISSKSAILIEASSGEILYELNSSESLKPASVTKVMTLLLCYEEIASGNMSYEDTVVISEHAASMGGSQCFFEAGEEQKVKDMLKCIEISSGNDAAVAMGEHIAGSEVEFVNMMNEKAKELGMDNTNFVNACGLDDENHYTSALDIGIMSRELITKYPEIFDLSTIWMDHITHKTSKGESRFDLANTNKFLKQYPGANGLKTGFTSDAGYCISATATRDDITLIAVIMGADTKETRNQEAGKLLDYGFSKCKIYTDGEVIANEQIIPIQNGVKDYVTPEAISEHTFTLVNRNPENVTKKLIINKNIKAPIKKGDVIGKIIYSIDNETINELAIKSSENIEKKSYSLSIRDLCCRFFVIE